MSTRPAGNIQALSNLTFLQATENEKIRSFVPRNRSIQHQCFQIPMVKHKILCFSPSALALKKFVMIKGDFYS